MKKNIRVPVSFSQDLRGDGQAPLFYPMAISLVCHMVFLVIFVVSPSLRSERPQARSVINVSMVSLKNPATKDTKTPAVGSKTPQIKKPEVVKKADTAPPVKKTAAVVKKPPPKRKTSLKKKTFKSTQVVKQAIQQLEEKVDTRSDAPAKEEQPEPLKSALDRLKKEVSQEEASRSTASGKKADRSTGKTGGKPGGFNEDGKKTAERIDLYRLEIAFQIQKNWAFNEQLAGGDQSLVAAIVFKVMPDGEIRDIFFTDRSGNTYLDESAYKAIVKSNPVDSHPSGLAQPYVVMAIRFTPQGIR
jgi:colicin import membrane protein